MYKKDVVFYTVIGSLITCACWTAFIVWSTWKILS